MLFNVLVSGYAALCYGDGELLQEQMFHAPGQSTEKASLCCIMLEKSCLNFSINCFQSQEFKSKFRLQPTEYSCIYNVLDFKV